MLSDKIFDISNENIIKSNYSQIKDLYEQNRDEINNNEIAIQELLFDEDVNKYLSLLENDKVKKYIECKRNISILKKEKVHLKEKLSFLHEHICEHPAYFVVEDFVSLSNERFIRCKCIECGKGTTRKLDELDDLYLIRPKNIENAEEEYKEYNKQYKRCLKRIS